MTLRLRNLGPLAGLALLATAVPALADAISPTTFTATVAVGGTVNLNKTVTVTKGVPTTAQADVFFLSDTTGSMGPAISTVRSNFNTITNSLTGNIAYGAGQFKDKFTAGDPFDYKLDQDITTSKSSVQTAINSWSASGGGDDPEQGLYALTQVADTTAWRSGSKRIVVITGDAPEHTGSQAAGGATVASTAAALKAAGVTLEAVNVSGLTGDSGLNSQGQFSGAGSLLGLGVAGSYSNAINSSSLVAAIQAAIGSAFFTYSSISLELIGAPAGVSVGFTPGCTGSFDRSVDRTCDFTVSFTGTAPGTYSFDIAGLVDGGIVATEHDVITVTGTSVPEPASMALLGTSLVGLGVLRRRRARR